MCIKTSSAWLGEARERPIMVGVDLAPMRDAMERGDPACGSGNFLVIAYKEMRSIEAEINRRRGEPDRRSDIPLTNFRGIELRVRASAQLARNLVSQPRRTSTIGPTRPAAHQHAHQ